MSKFYIGQKVVAIKDHSQGIFKKGDEFTVLGIGECCNTGLVNINIECVSNLKCECGKIHIGSWFDSVCFAPIELSTTTFEDLIKQFEPCLN